MNQFESIDKNTGENDQSHTEAYYEELACQEEIYLEEGEERARMVLISESSSRLNSDNGSQQLNKPGPDANCNPLAAVTVTKQLDDPVEALITGDADDPPLSEDVVAEMLRRTQNG